jgi:hypothetical protein
MNNTENSTKTQSPSIKEHQGNIAKDGLHHLPKIRGSVTMCLTSPVVEIRFAVKFWFPNLATMNDTFIGLLLNVT